ncbi:thioredoxin domain-containing protein [Neisseria sp.]|jgi:thiol:disulfide interchange protein DsbA|uniref:thioredoxin domain-containing protein n=1 Tax=Neisseria sp. TaxID=192066 RepID=UPI00289CD666|nr:thioredoxin domain-containing protein [Neisseria sp.]
MNRRSFLLAGGTFFLSAAAAVAAPEFRLGKEPDTNAIDNKMINPYQTVGNYKDDHHRVFMFISFDCPYCAESWYGYGKWGRTLPDPFKFVYVPLFGSQRMNTAAVTFYALRELAPHRLPEYMRQAFTLTASGHHDTTQYSAILRKMGFTDEQIGKAIKSSITEKRINRAIRLSKNYRVDKTPTFGVAGRYATHPGYTNGNYVMLKDLLNTLVTKAIENT